MLFNITYTSLNFLFFVLVTMLVYLFAVRRCVRDTELTDAQAKRYSPRRLRVIMINAAATGAIAVFAVACILQGLGQIYVETKYGQDTLNTWCPTMSRTSLNKPKNDRGTIAPSIIQNT